MRLALSRARLRLASRRELGLNLIFLEGYRLSSKASAIRNCLPVSSKSRTFSTSATWTDEPLDKLIRKHTVRARSVTPTPAKEMTTSDVALQRGPVDVSKGAHKPAVIRNRVEIGEQRRRARETQKSVGLVPTMGALHEGHLSLMRAAARENDEVWVTIFVNPTQFGPGEDLATYPSTFANDMKKIAQLNSELSEARENGDPIRGTITVVFNPTVDTMYPDWTKEQPTLDQTSYLTVNPNLTGVLEGTARPTFFRGVTTVVMKLFMATKPDRAYFGQKDIQQLVVINRMVKDFLLDIEIRPVPIERDQTGLALSSRNAYLGERRLAVATVLSRAIHAGQAALVAGKTSRDEVIQAALDEATKELEKQRALPPSQRARFEVEYISLANFDDLKEIEDTRHVERAILSATVIMLPLEEPRYGEPLGVGDDAKAVRLLDNLVWRNPAWVGTSKDATVAGSFEHGWH